MIKIPIIAEFNNKGIKSAVAEFKKLEGVGAKAKFLAGKAFSPAALTAYAAAATAVAAAGYDAAMAAAEDQKQQAILASTLRNTVNATDATIASTEEFITAMQMASGVSDSEFRVGLQNLTRATGDLQASQELLKLALDISVGSGKDLGSVTLALGKAFNGQVSSLKKLGLPLTEATVKTNDFEGAMRQLNAKFGGAAQANAETVAGKMAILSEKFGELKEKIGTLLLPILEDLVSVLGLATDLLDKFSGSSYKSGESLSFWEKSALVVGRVIKNQLGMTEMGVEATDDLTEAQLAAAESASILKVDLDFLYDALGRLTPQSKMAALGLEGLAEVADALGLSWRDTETKTRSFGSSIKENIENPLLDFLNSVKETRKEIQDNLAGAFDLGAIYQANENKFKPFMKSFTSQAAQFKNYASNLVKLKEMGLSPIAIQSIMQMDLATGSQFAQDLLSQSDVLKNVRQINNAYAGVNAAATSAGFALGTPSTGMGSTINVTVTSADPNAVVDALRRYQKRNGYIPITVG